MIGRDKKYKPAFQHALWDQFKLISEATPRKMSNLSRMGSTMLAHREGLTLTLMRHFCTDGYSKLGRYLAELIWKGFLL